MLWELDNGGLSCRCKASLRVGVSKEGGGGGGGGGGGDQIAPAERSLQKGPHSTPSLISQGLPSHVSWSRRGETDEAEMVMSGEGSVLLVGGGGGGRGGVMTEAVWRGWGRARWGVKWVLEVGGELLTPREGCHFP